MKNNYFYNLPDDVIDLIKKEVNNLYLIEKKIEKTKQNKKEINGIINYIAKVYNYNLCDEDVDDTFILSAVEIRNCFGPIYYPKIHLMEDFNNFYYG